MPVSSRFIVHDGHVIERRPANVLHISRQDGTPTNATKVKELSKWYWRAVAVKEAIDHVNNQTAEGFAPNEVSDR